MSASYPHRALAQEFSLPYWVVLCISDSLDPALHNPRNFWQRSAVAYADQRMNTLGRSMLVDDLKKIKTKRTGD